MTMLLSGSWQISKEATGTSIPPSGGVLPYIGYIGICGPKGNGFCTVLVWKMYRLWPFWSENRVCFSLSLDIEYCLQGVICFSHQHWQICSPCQMFTLKVEAISPRDRNKHRKQKLLRLFNAPKLDIPSSYKHLSCKFEVSITSQRNKSL